MLAESFFFPYHTIKFIVQTIYYYHEYDSSILFFPISPSLKCLT